MTEEQKAALEQDMAAVLAYLRSRRDRLARALNRVQAKSEGIKVELAALEAKIAELEEGE